MRKWAEVQVRWPAHRHRRVVTTINTTQLFRMHDNVRTIILALLVFLYKSILPKRKRLCPSLSYRKKHDFNGFTPTCTLIFGFLQFRETTQFILFGGSYSKNRTERRGINKDDFSRAKFIKASDVFLKGNRKIHFRVNKRSLRQIQLINRHCAVEKINAVLVILQKVEPLLLAM